MYATQIRGWLGATMVAVGLVKGIAEEKVAAQETPEARQVRLFKKFESQTRSYKKIF